MPELGRRAFQIATTGRPGPVQLDLPSNVMMESVDYPASEFYIHENHSAFPATRVRPAREDVVKAAELLLQAKKPVMICGEGVITSGAWREVVELAELLGIPVATTYMGKGSIIICDAGLNQIWGAEYFDVLSCGRTCLGTRGFGTMGFGFPAAVGAQLAAPDRRVVALVGDSGFAMTMQDLETAVRVEAPVVTVILDNQVLALSRLGQRRSDRFISTAFGPLDFAGVARAMGCFGRRVGQPQEIKGALREAFASGKPAVLDVLVTEEHVPHMELR